MAPPGIDSAWVSVKEAAMSDRTRPNLNDAPETSMGDPDMGSTWNTIDNTAEIDDLVNEEDLDTFLVEPIVNPLEVSPDRDESQDQRAPLVPDPSPRRERRRQP
jgi:hypothetical protein